MNYDYLAAILFFLPAGWANMWPVIANKIPYLNQWTTPIDFGWSYRGKRILGDNKTWRGLVTGTLIGGLTGLLVGALNQNAVGSDNQFLVGALLGFGALGGDAIESFFKRQLDIKPGQSWFPLDQIDYIIGGLLAVSLVVDLQVWVVGTIFVVYFGLHLLTAYVGYLLGFKEKPI